MQFIQRIHRRHRMHKNRLNFDEYNLLASLRNKQGLLKDAMEAVAQARGDRPLVNATLKEYTLQLTRRLISRGYLKKANSRFHTTPAADTIIDEIGSAEPFLLEKQCTPASISKISILSKAILILIFLYGVLAGGSLSLLTMIILLLLDSGGTIYFSHIDEQQIKINHKSKAALLTLILLFGFLFAKTLMAPLPLTRIPIGLLLTAFGAIIALGLTRFPLVILRPGRELCRRIASITGFVLVIFILLKGALFPSPIPRSLFTAALGLLGFSLFSVLHWLQKKTGQRYTTFSMFYLAGQSKRNAILSLLLTFTGLFSYFGIYHLDFLFPTAILIMVLLQILSLFRIALTRDARRKTLELWLEARSRPARRVFFFHWLRNLLAEQPATKSGILAIHNNQYEKKKAGISSGLSIYLDRDKLFEKELDLSLSNLLYDRSILIEHDKFTRDYKS